MKIFSCFNYYYYFTYFNNDHARSRLCCDGKISPNGSNGNGKSKQPKYVSPTTFISCFRWGKSIIFWFVKMKINFLSHESWEYIEDGYVEQEDEATLSNAQKIKIKINKIK